MFLQFQSRLFKMLQNTLKTDQKLREFIDNPTLQRQLKVEGLKQVASKFPLSSQSSNLLGKYLFIVLQLFLDAQCEAVWTLNNSHIFAVMSCLVTDFSDWHFSWYLLSLSVYIPELIWVISDCQFWWTAGIRTHRIILEIMLISWRQYTFL